MFVILAKASTVYALEKRLGNLENSHMSFMSDTYFKGRENPNAFGAVRMDRYFHNPGAGHSDDEGVVGGDMNEDIRDVPANNVQDGGDVFINLPKKNVPISDP